ncbi:24215_t:CDS:2 [Cetraspora pellucida]|uniref:24215_t:CDS:1 n=1 Tax=Cetraspora pellucida TaxID=1433469 RepID=A0A9N9GEX0_9GLOM|nr:24215_t:CDS:2 [Cetraspora pellucida]
MNITEDKWSIQQQSQVPPSPHHPHPVMSPQMNSMPTENFMQPFSYDGQATHQQIFVPMPPQNPSAARQANSPTNPSNNNSSNPASDRKVLDNRPTFTTTFHATPFQTGAARKRRTDVLGFAQDSGPFFSPTQQHYSIYSVDRSLSAFSISGTTHNINEADVPCLIEVDGQFHSVNQYLLGITARVSNSDKKIELVQHTPKRDKGPQMVPVPKPIRAGGNLSLSSVGSNSNIVTFERIQFKTATANNGKRRAAQQYYVVMVDLYAQTENGEYRVATSTSAPLVVRGRSPGHYADNHDRYNPMGINPTFPNDRHMGFPHPQGPNGAPMMPPDFNGAPFPGPYSQYQPFSGYPPVNGGPIRNDALLMMGSNGQAPQFHPQHPHQQYMVQSVTDNDNQNQEMYSNANMDPTIVNSSHDPKLHEMHMDGVTATSGPHSAFSNFESRQIPTTVAGSNASQGSKPFMKIEIPPSSEIPDHPLTSPAYHSQEYVEGFHMYNGSHPANNASTHHGGYHSDSEQHNMNGRPTRPDGSLDHNHSPQMKSDKSEHNSKPLSTNKNITTPTTELGKNLSQLNMNYRMSKMEEDKL